MDMLLFSQSCLGFFSQSNNRIKDPYFSSLEHKVSYLNQHLNSYFPFSIASKELKSFELHINHINLIMDLFQNRVIPHTWYSLMTVCRDNFAH